MEGFERGGGMGRGESVSIRSLAYAGTWLQWLCRQLSEICLLDLVLLGIWDRNQLLLCSPYLFTSGHNREVLVSANRSGGRADLLHVGRPAAFLNCSADNLLLELHNFRTHHINALWWRRGASLYVYGAWPVGVGNKSVITHVIAFFGMESSKQEISSSTSKYSE